MQNFFIDKQIGVPDQNNVSDMFENFHRKKKSKIGGVGGGLYRGADGSITVVLPQDLCWDWANAAGGNSGGKNPRPVGIRLLPQQVKDRYGNQNDALKTIFSSKEALTDFIMSSDRLGKQKLQALMAKKKLKKAMANRGMVLMSNEVDHGNTTSKEVDTVFTVAELAKKLLELALEKKDNELAKLVLLGKIEQYL